MGNRANQLPLVHSSVERTKAYGTAVEGNRELGTRKSELGARITTSDFRPVQLSRSL